MATVPITKAELYQALKAQTKELTAYTDQQTEKLAGIVDTAYSVMAEPAGNRSLGSVEGFFRRLERGKD